MTHCGSSYCRFCVRHSHRIERDNCYRMLWLDHSYDPHAVRAIAVFVLDTSIGCSGSFAIEYYGWIMCMTPCGSSYCRVCVRRIHRIHRFSCYRAIWLDQLYDPLRFELLPCLCPTPTSDRAEQLISNGWTLCLTPCGSSYCRFCVRDVPVVGHETDNRTNNETGRATRVVVWGGVKNGQVGLCAGCCVR